MKIGIKTGDIMTRNFISVNPESSLLECARTMVKKRVGSLILQEKDVLKGIVTEGDIIWALTKKSRGDLGKIKARDIAPKKLITIKPSADLSEALQKMKKTKYRWMPVTLKGNVIGLITLKDILKIQPELFEIIGQSTQIREESDKIRRLKSGEKFREGMCEECGNFDMIYRVDDRLMCESCRDEI